MDIPYSPVAFHVEVTELVAYAALNPSCTAISAEGIATLGFESPNYPRLERQGDLLFYPKNKGLYVGSWIYATASPPSIYKIHGAVSNERDFLFSKGKITVTQGCIGSKV